MDKNKNVTVVFCVLCLNVHAWEAFSFFCFQRNVDFQISVMLRVVENILTFLENLLFVWTQTCFTLSSFMEAKNTQVIPGNKHLMVMILCCRDYDSCNLDSSAYGAVFISNNPKQFTNPFVKKKLNKKQSQDSKSYLIKAVCIDPVLIHLSFLTSWLYGFDNSSIKRILSSQNQTKISYFLLRSHFRWP